MLFTTLLLVATASAALASPLESRALPTPIPASTARTYLSKLVVENEINDPPYSRSLFPHWTQVSGSCNTRETVLKRDGTDVVTARDCSPTSGHWVSPYDNVATNLASDLDIDHVVPLKEAWRSGARLWTTAQRRVFANDLIRPQLVAVTDDLNQQKDPSKWTPPLASFHCTYARAWVHVKHFYNLTVDTAEKAALSRILNRC
ncbi:hypothetical protein AMATHDRAFT_77059 [Amanita thiersii Skay4041]|uniref:GmrSD restriction endonucleases C-terminal domain-containing protein n=1 Tax=Amanita thiersii Skay4041 TaxID=703135 RepID=A0A2A9NAT4_9AGAR|nr:hypothetical protein AMATHDRAFT_77059 [Amanita thiersii Skay4041]